MSAKRFKFVSPGVFINEIDNSQLPNDSDRLGPVIIGRTERGPAMRPVTVKSQAEFIEMFGQPIPGGRSGDVWREGNYQSPTYASYAAMAYLRNNAPVTMVRLLGHEHENKTEGAGNAGWSTSVDAYGLWLYDSASIDANNLPGVTGTLAAIWYFDKGAIALSGNLHTTATGAHAGYSAGAVDPIESTCMSILSVGDNREFKATIWEHDSTFDSTTQVLQTTFNFDKTSDKFIRKVFNTNPSLLSDGSEISSDNAREYFLGQTFEDQIDDHLVSSSAGDVVGLITPLNDGTMNFKDFRLAGGAQAATTGWILSQQLGSDSGSLNLTAANPVGVNKLFKLNALDCGEWESNNLKVSIEDIRYSRNQDENPYGAFTVAVRKREDHDAAPKYVERFTNCNLNPMSPDYVKRKIGDQTLSWDEGERRYKVVGDYPNNSKFIRVEVNTELDNAALDPQLLPFGFQGPYGLNKINVRGHNGSALSDPTVADIQGTSDATTILLNSTTKAHRGTTNTKIYTGGNVELKWPELRNRLSSDDGQIGNRKAAFWGVSTMASGSVKETNRGWSDLMYPHPAGIANGGAYAQSASFAFSLDDVTLSNGTSEWAEDNRKNGLSYSTLGTTGVEGEGSYKDTLDEGINRFTMPLWGGFDGLQIGTLDPFAPDLHVGSTDKASYEYYSIKKAIDMCSDPEVVECNLMTVPGCTNNGINQHLVNIAENRGDCLAILDLKGGYKPRSNRTNSETAYSSYGGTVSETLTNLRDLAINSSYACSYYPWVQVRDTGQDAVVWVPPSVVALGTMGSSEAQSEVWFAPAGFTRGGLSEGSAGMPVVGVRDRLTSKQRDELYAENVNPIATFPAEGIVIFGQKTMQVTPSALDRINVRRLMIFVKKEISRMAATTLFDQNVKRTWNRFLGRVNPFLRSVQTRLGLTGFKVVLDETTTTPELIDRNIMYAKILLKPARAIEYIAIDFVITDSGASFED